MLGLTPFDSRTLYVFTLASLGLMALMPRAAAQGKLGTPVPANPVVRRLTLEQARQLAIAGNKSLALARLNLVEKQYGVTASRKDYFPKLMGNVTYFHFNDNLGNINVASKGTFGVLPAGTPLIGTSVLNQNTALSTVFVAQPITKLIGVNALVQIARADEGAARAQLDKGTRDLLSGLTQAYYALVGAQRIHDALVLQIQVVEQVIKAKPLPELRIGLIEARQGLVQVRGQIQELTQIVNDLLDLPSCTILELVDPVPADLPLRCAEDACQLALSHSPEIQEAEHGILKATAALRVAKMDYLPDVSIVGGYANQTAASYVQPNIGYFGAVANYTFWGWGKRRDVKLQRETLVSLAHQNVAVTRGKISLAAQKAYIAYEQAREAYQLAGELMQARKEFQAGAKGPTVLQASADTAKAELEHMKAEIGFRVAHAQLAALIGH